MDRDKRCIIYFVVSAVFVLESILLVSSQTGKKFYELADYDKLYQNCLKVDLLLHEDTHKEMHQTKAMLKKQVPDLTDFTPELFQEVLCIEWVLESSGDNVKNIIIAFHMKYLVSYYCAYTRILSSRIKEGGNLTDEDRELIKHLEFMHYYLLFHKRNPPYEKLFGAIMQRQQLPQKKNADRNPEAGPSNEDLLDNVRELENLTISSPGSSSVKDVDLETGFDMYFDKKECREPFSQMKQIMENINNFFHKLLPGCTLIDIKDNDLDENVKKTLLKRLVEFDLFNPKSEKIGGSRTMKMVQILMEVDGYNVFESGEATTFG